MSAFAGARRFTVFPNFVGCLAYVRRRLEGATSMRGLACALPTNEAATTAFAAVRNFLADAHPAVQFDIAPSLDSAVANPPDFLVAFISSPELAALRATLEKIHIAAPACVTIVVAESLTQSEIAALFRAGVQDFVATSASVPELFARIDRSLGTVCARPTEIRSIVHPRVRDIVGESPAFTRALAKLPTLAGCDAGVLILGETGTGKEIFAAAVHYLSARASRPWVAVNCGAIPQELVENELFGHVRGAYTTAHTSQNGLVREAEGGTLFLDEIDTLSYEAQAKMLRFVQTKEYRPVGASVTQHADVRLIAASNQSLESQVAAGKFRRDLFYRLNILNLSLPALRERRDDIPALALYFVRRFASAYRRSVTGLGAQAIAHLVERDWPGNVRELQHVIERAVLMSQGTVLTLADLEQRAEVTDAPESFRSTKARMVESFERSYLEHLLSVNNGNITSAATAARKNRRALFELIRKYKIDPDRFRAHTDPRQEGRDA